MKVIIDRFEEDFAVLELESGEMLNAPKALFEEFSEGANILITEAPQKDGQCDLQENSSAEQKEESAAELFRKLRKKSRKKAKKSAVSTSQYDEK